MRRRIGRNRVAEADHHAPSGGSPIIFWGTPGGGGGAGQRVRTGLVSPLYWGSLRRWYRHRFGSEAPTVALVSGLFWVCFVLPGIGFRVCSLLVRHWFRVCSSLVTKCYLLFGFVFSKAKLPIVMASFTRLLRGCS